MRRVAVIGNCCSGKTTLGRALAARLGLAYLELDALNHGPDWSEASGEELAASVCTALEGHSDGWVIDGNYQGKIGDLVVARADTVVWLDLPLPLILWRLLRRTSGRITRRTELWNGNRETFRNAFLSRDSLFLWTLGAQGRHRREQPARLGRLEARIVHLRSPGEVRSWLAAQPEAPSTRAPTTSLR